MTQTPKRQIPFPVVVIFLLADLIIVLAAVWYFSAPADKPTPARAEAWAAAVAAGQEQQALLQSVDMVAAHLDRIVNQSYPEFLTREGFKSDVLEAPFSTLDYLGWRQASFFRSQADALCEGQTGDPLQRLYDGARKQLQPVLSDASASAFPEQCWKEGKASPASAAWIMAELAYQRGYEVQVVYLFPAANSTKDHFLTEVRRPNEVYLIDVWGGLFLKGVSIDKLAASPELLKTVWAEHPEFRAATAQVLLFTPALPGDFAYRNQKLAEYLRHDLGPKAPRFGEDPETRMKAYWRLREPEKTDKGLFAMRLWPDPIRQVVFVLKSAIK